MGKQNYRREAVVTLDHDAGSYGLAYVGAADGVDVDASIEAAIEAIQRDLPPMFPDVDVRFEVHHTEGWHPPIRVWLDSGDEEDERALVWDIEDALNKIIERYDWVVEYQPDEEKDE